MNAGGGFTGFSKGSINMSDHPIADNTTRSISVKDGVVTKTLPITVLMNNILRQPQSVKKQVWFVPQQLLVMV